MKRTWVQPADLSGQRAASHSNSSAVSLGDDTKLGVANPMTVVLPSRGTSTDWRNGPK